MTLPVTSPEFWKRRLLEAHATGRGLHSAIYDTSPENWNRNQNLLAGVLRRVMADHEPKTLSVLDVGCGYGAAYDLMPAQVKRYHGIDISPELIEIARLRHPEAEFSVADATSLPQFEHREFDWVVARSVKEMLLLYGKRDVWESIARELRRVSKFVLTLDYLDQDSPQEEFKYQVWV